MGGVVSRSDFTGFITQKVQSIYSSEGNASPSTLNSRQQPISSLKTSDRISLNDVSAKDFSNVPQTSANVSSESTETMRRDHGFCKSPLMWSELTPVDVMYASLRLVTSNQPQSADTESLWPSPQTMDLIMCHR